MKDDKPMREGNLEAPTRHPVDWQSAKFYDKDDLYAEMERVFDICHGCRRCVSLCRAFPDLFDLVDESETMEVDGVDKQDYMKVVDQCYLCDMCYMTKCPYVPPHEWNLDFPHLMLRAKAYKFKQQGASFRDRTLTGTDRMGKLASIPIISETVNAMNNNGAFRSLLQSGLGVHKDAVVPKYHSNTLRKRAKQTSDSLTVKPVGNTSGKVALYATCYGNYNSPDIGEDLLTVFRHNDIHIELVPKEQCCGMPKLELGDLESIRQAKEANIPILAALVDQGYDLTAPVPSCVLMYKQELPLLFPDDEDVKKVQKAFFDPFEYLFLRHKAGEFKTDFKQGLGEVGYQVACHLRVQNIGMKTRDILNLIPDTTIHAQERCSGHDGTYAVRRETYDDAVKIARPVVRKIDQLNVQHLSSDCPMAAAHLAELSETIDKPEHPMSLLRLAYGL
jgi:Fe-S oxidoreductase